MNSSIFRKYDIRGVAERDLGDRAVSELARSLATCLERHEVCSVSIGQDCRLSSPRIADTLARGLLASGLNVVRLGTIPTPVVYFSQYHLQVEAGIMVTGSHNPGHYNGLKIVANGEAWSGDQIQQIRAVWETRAWEEGPEGALSSISVLADYLQAIQARLEPLREHLKVVIDCGNGVTAGLVADLYRQLGCRVSELFGSMDGHFPNHHPDPSVEGNLRELKSEVRRQKADLGIAFDGDGDRIAAIDHTGEVVWGDRLTLLFAQDILSRHPGATVIGEVKCTVHLFREVERLGGHALMIPAGHSLMRREMRRSGALLAGEMSGHIFFADNYFGFDDAIYAGARLLELLSRTQTSLAQHVSSLPVAVSTPEIRVRVDDSKKSEIVERAKRWFSERYSIISVDGVRIEFADGWGLVRASHTGPYLILRFEAVNWTALERIRRVIELPLGAMLEGREHLQGFARAVQGEPGIL